MKKHIRWYTGTTTYVDINTGEEITKHKAKTEYTKLKTDEYYTYNYNQTIGFKHYTIRCGPKSQLSLKFGDDK